MTFREPTMAEKRTSVSRGAKASREHWDANELDVKLDMLLGATNDVSMYADCIRAAKGKDRKQ